MAKVRQSNEWTESDAVAEVAVADPSDFVLETFPPEYVERISQFIESSSVLCSSQNREDGAAEGEPAEADSDSADSLFITQKSVPEAVRSGRQKCRSLRSGLTSPREREESEDDRSPLASPQDTRSKRKKKEIKLRMPKYSFPFLKDKMPKLKGIFLSEVQNTRLHYSSMGAFFDCIRKLQQSYQTVEDLESNLPAIDVNGECISPISEGEEENLGDEDMKVVAKKRFVIPSKERHSQSWYSEKKRYSKGKQWREGYTNSGGKMPPGGWGVVLHKIPTKKPSLKTAQSSDLESSDDEDPSCRFLTERGTSHKRLTRQSVCAQTETLKTNRKKRDSSEEKEKEDELSDDSNPPQTPKECIQKCRVSNKEELSQEGQGDGQPEDQRIFQSDTNNATTCSETKVKKKQNYREDNESAEEDDNASQEEVEVQYAAPSINEEVTEVEESPHLSQTISELELNEKNGMEESVISDSEQGTKKRDSQENENTEEEKSQSQDELEDQHAAASANEEITEEEEESPCLSQVASQLDLNGKTIMEDSDFPESQQKKKKKKSSGKDVRHEVHEHAASDTWIGEDSVHLVSCNRGKEKKKKYQKDHERAEEEKSQGQELEVQHAAASVNEEIIEEEEREIPHSQQKKKKKKKRKKSPEEHEKTEKEKKKKKRTESNNGEEEDVEQLKCNIAAESLHDDVEIPTKKKKKKKGTEKKKDFEDGGEGFKNTEAFQENLETTLESSSAKRKKHKKSSQRDESNTPEDEENLQKTDEIEDHDAGQLVTKKKKKKTMREMSSMEGSNDTLAQSSDPLSVQQKKKKKKSSFLCADVEGKAAHSEEEKHCPSRSVSAEQPGVSTGSSAESAEITVSLDESNERVRKKKKKKRKMSDVEKDLEPDFEELKETCEEALSDTGLKKKKKKPKRNKTESATPVKGSESADARCSDEAVVLKKNRTKNMQETPAAPSEETESESLFEHASPSLDTPGKDSKKKKKGKSAHNVSLWSKEQSYERSITTKEGRKTDRKERKRTADCSFTTQLSKTSVLPSPHSIKKNKQKKLKRTLHNPSEDFLTDSQYQ